MTMLPIGNGAAPHPLFNQSPLPGQVPGVQNFAPAPNPQMGLQGVMQSLMDAGATQLPPVASGPAGQTDYGLAQNLPPEDTAGDLDYYPPIDRERIKGLTPDRVDELAQQIYRMAWEGVESKRSGGHADNIEMFRDLYEGVLDEEREGPWEGACELSTPDTRTQVETVAARIREAVFTSTRWLTVRPGFPEDTDACQKCRDFAKSENGGPNVGLPALIYQASQDACVDGHVVGMVGWKRSREKKRRRTIINDATLIKMGLVPPMVRMNGTPIRVGKKLFRYGQWATLETDEVTENHITLDFISANDTTMWPADSPSIESAVLFGYFFGETPDEMRRKVNEGYYDKDAIDDIIEHSSPMMPGNESGLQSISEESSNRDNVSRGYESMSDTFGRRKMLYCHARVHDGDNDDIFEDICFIMEWSTRKFCRIALPDVLGRPWQKFRLYPRVGGGYYDYSLVEKLFDTQQELNSITRQGVDAGTLAMSAIVEQSSGRRKAGDTPFGPGITFWDSDLDGEISKIHNFPSVPNSNLVDREQIRRMIEKIGGSDEVTQGLGAGSSSGTLGQTNLAVAGGNIRLKAALEYVMQFLTWYYERFFSYHRYYMEERRSYEVIRNGRHSYPSITLDDLAVTEYATVQAYSSNLDPQAALRAQKVQVLFQALANSPFVQNNFERQGRLLVFLAQALDVEDDLSEFIGTPDEWRQMDQTYAETMAQAGPQGTLPNDNGAPGPQGSAPPSAPQGPQTPVAPGRERSTHTGPNTSIGPSGMGPQSIPLGGGKPR